MCLENIIVNMGSGNSYQYVLNQGEMFEEELDIFCVLTCLPTELVTA